MLEAITELYTILSSLFFAHEIERDRPSSFRVMLANQEILNCFFLCLVRIRANWNLAIYVLDITKELTSSSLSFAPTKNKRLRTISIRTRDVERKWRSPKPPYALGTCHLNITHNRSNISCYLIHKPQAFSGWAHFGPGAGVLIRPWEFACLSVKFVLILIYYLRQ